MSKATHKPRILNVGIMCHGLLGRWHAEAIRHVLAVPGVRIALMIVIDSSDPGENTLLVRKPVGRFRNQARGYFLWQLYRRVSRAIRNEPPHDSGSFGNELQGVPVIRCNSQPGTQHSQQISRKDIAAIKSHDLDVVLSVGCADTCGEVPDIARYGVWSFQHDHNLMCQGAPPGFWEIYQGDKTVPATLWRLTGSDEGSVIRQEYLNTISHSYSQNLNHLYMESVGWPANACRALLAGEGAEIFVDPVTCQGTGHRSPTDLQILVFLSRLTMRLVWKQLQDLFGNSYESISHWAIGIVREPPADLVGRDEFSVPEWFEPPEGSYFADPFAIVSNDLTYLFFEDYDHQSKKGHISVVETGDLRTFSQVQPVLEQPFHLSYPYVIEYDGRYFMIPEQAESGEVALYEAENFPCGWVKRSTLLPDFPGVDPTLFRYEGRWWMFLGKLDHDPASNLYAFCADDLLGPWRPHKQNPIKTEPQLCRSGGAPFYLGNDLVRPAQDCSRIYGGRLIINKITSLTEWKFEEKFVGYLEPGADWLYSEGLHTISSIGNVTIIDGNRVSRTRRPLDRAVAAKSKTFIGSFLRIPRALQGR